MFNPPDSGGFTSAQIAALELDFGRIENAEAALFPPWSSVDSPSFGQTFGDFELPESLSDHATYPDHEAMLFAGTGFDTYYLGASNPLAVVAIAPTFLRTVSVVRGLHVAFVFMLFFSPYL